MDSEILSEKRIGVVGVVIEDTSSVSMVNNILHEHADVIVGRMGVPYRERGVSIISLIVDGTIDKISSMTGKLGKLEGVSVKSAFTRK